MADRILVLGGAGRLGKMAAEAFRDAGWMVTSLVRPGAGARAAQGTEIIEAEAHDQPAVARAAEGAQVVLHALNPLYSDWPVEVPRLTEAAIAAARSANATLLFPGNVYNFGPDMPGVLTDRTPMHPSSRKGALRVAAENRLREASQQGLQVIILRAGDFYGGAGTGSWFDRVIVQQVNRGRVVYPGPLDVVHAWAYLPDLAAAMVRLAEARQQLGGFEAFGFPGHAVTGREFVQAVAKGLGRKLQIGRMPWWLLRLLGPFIPIYRELTEMQYLWQVPHRLDGSKLEGVIGPVPHTPLPSAVARALQDLGFPPARR